MYDSVSCSIPCAKQPTNKYHTLLPRVHVATCSGKLFGCPTHANRANYLYINVCPLSEVLELTDPDMAEPIPSGAFRKDVFNYDVNSGRAVFPHESEMAKFKGHNPSFYTEAFGLLRALKAGRPEGKFWMNKLLVRGMMIYRDDDSAVLVAAAMKFVIRVLPLRKKVLIVGDDEKEVYTPVVASAFRAICMTIRTTKS
jgi:hypothetical protein